MADTIFSKGYSFVATERGDYDIRAFEKKYGDVRMPNRNKSEGLAPWVLRVVQSKGFDVRVTHTQGERPRVKDVYVSKEAMDWIVGFQEELKEQDSSKVNHGLDEGTKEYLDGWFGRMTQRFDDITKTVMNHAERLVRGEHRLDGHDQDIRDLKAGQSKVRQEQDRLNDTFAEDRLRADRLERELKAEREARERLERVYNERLAKLEKRRFGL